MRAGVSHNGDWNDDGRGFRYELEGIADEEPIHNFTFLGTNFRSYCIEIEELNSISVKHVPER